MQQHSPVNRMPRKRKPGTAATLQTIKAVRDGNSPPPHLMRRQTIAIQPMEKRRMMEKPRPEIVAKTRNRTKAKKTMLLFLLRPMLQMATVTMVPSRELFRWG